MTRIEARGPGRGGSPRRRRRRSGIRSRSHRRPVPRGRCRYRVHHGRCDDGGEDSGAALGLCGHRCSYLLGAPSRGGNFDRRILRADQRADCQPAGPRRGCTPCPPTGGQRPADRLRRSSSRVRTDRVFGSKTRSLRTLEWGPRPGPPVPANEKGPKPVASSAGSARGCHPGGHGSAYHSLVVCTPSPIRT
jgi:hypothetical protein